MKPGPKKLYPCRNEVPSSQEWQDGVDEWRRRRVTKYDPERGVYIRMSRAEAIRQLVLKGMEK